MSEPLLLQLVGVLCAGLAAQWLAWRFRLPSIVLLLVIGFVVGPVFGWIHPDDIFGRVLFPMVSASVAVILFEGSLSLNFREVRQAGIPVLGLITVGVAVTGLLATVGARWIFHWPWHMAVLMGSLLTVTGPTVVLPLLRTIRPSRQVGAILKWEGMLNDPIGAVLAVLVLKVLLLGEYSQAIPFIAQGFLNTLLAGLIAGGLGAGFLVVVLKRFWMPDVLQNPFSLAVVLGVFAGANHFQGESGLLAVTVMGIVLANQSWTPVRQIVEFKENIRVLLLTSLFILLAARAEPRQLIAIKWEALAYLVWLMIVVRPAAVWCSTIGGRLTWREKLLLSWMAPRGIVAAAVASIFVLELTSFGHSHAVPLEGVVFLIIVSLALLYGFTAPWLAKRLGLAQEDSQGVLFVGAHPMARALAGTLRQQGFQVLLVDTNHENIVAARMEGHPVAYASVLSSSVEDELDLEGLGHLVAVTSNDEVNALAALRFRSTFSKARVYQLSCAETASKRHEAIADEFRGRRLFDREITYATLAQRLESGWTLKTTRFTSEFNYESWLRQYPNGAIPLFMVDEKGRLIIVAADHKLKPKQGQTLISLIAPLSKEGG